MKAARELGITYGLVMSLENALVYNFASGDSTYPHRGRFTVGVAGKVTIDDSNGSDDAIFGDHTHTGGADVPDQDVTASTVAGINVGDTIDVRYKYTITGSDGSSGTIYFVATNSANNYGPLFVSDSQLDPGVTYTFRTFNTDGAVEYSSLVPCFTSGTQIMTDRGERCIDDLVEGDLVFTRDNGFQPLRWIGRRRVAAIDQAAPISIGKGVLGNSSELLVSPNHRMLITGVAADLSFGESEVFVAAKHLTNNPGVSIKSGGQVTYVHLLFDQHQVVMANNAPSESFYPGEQALNSLEKDAREEVLTLFPELRTLAAPQVLQTARMCLKKWETQLLQI